MEEQSPKRKAVIIAVSAAAVIIVLALLALAYFGIMNPASYVSSVLRGDSAYYSETGRMSLEVENGGFAAAEAALRKAVSETGADIYRESINENDGVSSAYFTIDVPEVFADNLIAKLRAIGNVKSFSYSKGGAQPAYGTDGLKQGHVRITVSLTETRSVFSSFENLKANALGTTLSSSIVALLYFLVAILPWVILIVAVFFLVRFIRRKMSE